MKRMKTIKEMYDQLKEFFVDKTSANEQTMASALSALSFKSNTFLITDLGLVNGTDLISTKISNNISGIYKYNEGTSSQPKIIIVEFSDTNIISGLCIAKYNVYYFANINISIANFYQIAINIISSATISFSPCTSVNANLGGAPTFGVENSTLHIKGSFTPSVTISAGTKLFTTTAISARMTHGSAINTGSVGAETFVGLSIQTNGDVYTLGSLTNGVTYNIAVTATM